FAGALVHHPGHHYANPLATRAKCFIFGHSANSQRQVLDEGRSRKDRVVGFQCEFSAGKITEHEIGFAETDIDCNRQPGMRSDLSRTFYECKEIVLPDEKKWVIRRQPVWRRMRHGPRAPVRR